MNSVGEFGPQGQAIYNALRSVQNLQLMTCGHIADEERRNDTYNAIARLDARGLSGPRRGWRRLPAHLGIPREHELTVRSYSPTHDRWRRTQAASSRCASISRAQAARSAHSNP